PTTNNYSGGFINSFNACEALTRTDSESSDEILDGASVGECSISVCPMVGSSTSVCSIDICASGNCRIMNSRSLSRSAKSNGTSIVISTPLGIPEYAVVSAARQIPAEGYAYDEWHTPTETAVHRCGSASIQFRKAQSDASSFRRR